MNLPAATTSSQLAQLISPAADAQSLWRADELGAIWRHQLAAPLQFDLGGVDESLAEECRSVSATGGAAAATFGGLFAHPAPPLALLERVKDFAKIHSTHPESLLPREISMALYYVAIAAALTRCNRRISSLNIDILREGLQRVARFPWLDEGACKLLQEALSVYQRR